MVSFKNIERVMDSKYSKVFIHADNKIWVMYDTSC